MYVLQRRLDDLVLDRAFRLGHEPLEREELSRGQGDAPQCSLPLEEPAILAVVRCDLVVERDQSRRNRMSVSVVDGKSL